MTTGAGSLSVRQIRAEIKQSAESDLGSKLRLEAAFKRDLRPIFASMVRDLLTQFAANGTESDATVYQSELEAALRRHYERVQREFRGTVDPDPDLDEALLLIFLLYRNSRAPQQARIITGTNQRMIRDAIATARADLFPQGVTDSRSIAANAAGVMRSRAPGRIETIALTETQNAAENTKNQEAQEAERIRKTWVTVGDKRVRPTHRAASGQRRDIDEPFIVGGAALMYPGDMSLGAPIRETAGCRCSAVYR